MVLTANPDQNDSDFEQELAGLSKNIETFQKLLNQAAIEQNFVIVRKDAVIAGQVHDITEEALILLKRVRNAGN